MLWALRQLLVPCNYLRIRQGGTLLQSKAVYDWVLPAILTALSVAVCVWVPLPLQVHGHKVFASSLSSLLALLIAFYMAALAAVATFQREGIDEPLRGEPALLKVLNHDTGLTEDKALSYRQFISYLFGYLSFSSLLLFLSLMAMTGVWPRIIRKLSVMQSWAPTALHSLDALLFCLFLFGVWQMFVTSILGIYFLADRMQSLRDVHS